MRGRLRSRWLRHRARPRVRPRGLRRLRQVLGILGLRAALVLSVAFGFTAGAARAQFDGPPFPRLANCYLHGAVDSADIPILSRWDVLILDSAWSEEDLAQLRELNPDIRIFLYVCAYCVDVPPPPGDSWRSENYGYASTHDLWWRNWNRTIASDWPNTQLVNITELGAAGPQGPWRQFIAGRVESLIRDRPSADGVFYDNFWSSIGWQQGGIIQLDSDCNPTHNPAGCDGAMDSDARADSLWNRALRALAQDTRVRFDVLERGRSRPLGIVTNGSADYFSSLNGTMHEYFPSRSANPDPGNPYGYNWNQQMLALPGGYLVAPFRTTPYRVSVLNAAWDGTWAAPNRSADFERHKRFTLASTLMGDGYYSLDAAEMGHGSIWWEPEYDHAGRGTGYLGYPLGPMRRVGVPSGPERVVNGGFDAGTQPWESLPWQATGSWRLDTNTYHSAPAAARIDVSSVSPGGSFKLYQSLPVEGGRGYTLAFWGKASAPQELLLHLYSPSCPNYTCLGNTRVQIGTSWQRHEIAFVAAGTSASAGLNIFVSTPGTVWLDDVTIREGDTSVYRRDFENGIVLLNYTNSTQTIPLGTTYHRLSVPGSALYDGAAVTHEALAPSDGRILLAGAPAGTPPPPRTTYLAQNEPNPFNPSTRIRFKLEQDQYAHLAIYDVAGRLVKTLVSRRQPGGVERGVTWDGTDRYGFRVRSGVYFYRLATPTYSETRKLTLLH